MTCTDCGKQRPCLFRLIDDTGSHPRCYSCFLQLVAAVEHHGGEITAMVIPAPVPA